MTETPPGFCETLPSQPKVWDPTRLAIADTCWRKHLLATIRGLRRNGQPSVHLTWGKAYHQCVEWHDTVVLKGEPDSAMGCALALAELQAVESQWGETLPTWRCTDPELVPAKRLKNEDGSPKLIQNRARCKFAKWQPVVDVRPHECECGQPVEFGETFVPYDPKKTGETLIAAVKAYCESTTSLKPYQFPDGTKGLELQVCLLLPISSPDWGHPYKLLANIDSLVEWEGDIAIRERKTTGRPLDWRYWAQFHPNAQIETYDLVGSVLYQNEDGRPPKIMVEAMQIGGVEGPKIERRVIHLTEAQRAETFRETQSLILDAEKRAFDTAAGITPEVAFPRRPTACIKGFQVCPFYDVCTASPSAREAIIAANYHVERWDPEAAESFREESE